MRHNGHPMRGFIPSSTCNLSFNRRDFFKHLGTAVSVVGMLRSIPRVSGAAGQQGVNSFIAWIGKDERMIVHNTRPGVLETPLELLREHHITPKGIMFVRNNQVIAEGLTLRPIRLQGWTIEMLGLLKYPRRITGEDLLKYEQREVEMTMQCSGNGRSYYSQSVKTRGTQWQKGGIANVRWKGVPLETLIEALKPEIHPAAKFITAEGKDSPLSARGADFEHSVPLEDVLDTAILALEMNGEPIPAIHGGPVRLIIPGYYGTMNIKWLDRLRFEAHETSNYNHIPRYRTFVDPIKPGTIPPFTFENSAPNWRQKIKSIIWAPLEGERIEAGRIEVKGVAWNAGRTKIETVEVSVNKGKTWQRAELEASASAYAWHHWKMSLQLSSGDREIWARAVDAIGQVNHWMVLCIGTPQATNGTVWIRLKSASCKFGKILHAN